MTLSDLSAMFPHAHIEMAGEDAEIVIYTGLTVDESVPGSTWLRWTEGMFE